MQLDTLVFEKKLSPNDKYYKNRIILGVPILRLYLELVKTILAIVLLFISVHASAQTNIDELKNQSKEFNSYLDSLDLFADNTPLKITLSSDFKNLSKNKDKSEYQKARLTIHINDTVNIEEKIKIKTRGVMRKRICYHPPLQLNFSKKTSSLKQLREYDKLKLVQGCKDGVKYDQYLLSEYLVYKMYNVFTDYSFRVRLLNVNFIDVGGRYKPKTKYAFIIEPIDQILDKNESLSIEKKHLRSTLMDQEVEGVMSVYQYMIGNTDWSVAGLHNLKLIKPKDFTVMEPIPIPYDFDYSGFVDAEYAIPSTSIPIEDISERYFMGACRTEDEFKQIFANFKSKEQELYDLIDGLEPLTSISKKKQTKFLQSFYKSIESNYVLQNDFLGNCQKKILKSQ